MMDDEKWAEFISVIDKALPLGEKNMPNGTKLIGHVPHVAPLAYLHSIFPVLSDEAIRSIEGDIGKGLSFSLIQFYKRANGVQLFSGALSINGYRKDYGRSIESVLSQPFDIVTANREERIKDAEQDIVFFGSYQSDGSKLYMKFSENSVYRCSRQSCKPLNQWPSFMDMLVTEAKRLAMLFDSEGKKIDKGKPTTPLNNWSQSLGHPP